MPGAGDAWHGRRYRALSARQRRPASGFREADVGRFRCVDIFWLGDLYGVFLPFPVSPPDICGIVSWLVRIDSHGICRYNLECQAWILLHPWAVDQFHQSNRIEPGCFFRCYPLVMPGSPQPFISDILTL